jgi:hypothetical protein
MSPRPTRGTAESGNPFGWLEGLMPRDVELDSATTLRLRAADLQRLAREAKHDGVARELDLMALHYLDLARRLEIARRLAARPRRTPPALAGRREALESATSGILESRRQIPSPALREKVASVSEPDEGEARKRHSA